MIAPEDVIRLAVGHNGAQRAAPSFIDVGDNGPYPDGRARPRGGALVFDGLLTVLSEASDFDDVDRHVANHRSLGHQLGRRNRRLILPEDDIDPHAIRLRAVLLPDADSDNIAVRLQIARHCLGLSRVQLV